MNLQPPRTIHMLRKSIKLGQTTKTRPPSNILSTTRQVDMLHPPSSILDLSLPQVQYHKEGRRFFVHEFCTMVWLVRRINMLSSILEDDRGGGKRHGRWMLSELCQKGLTESGGSWDGQARPHISECHLLPP